MKSKFFTFNQNNSGGSFSFDANRGISHYVIIEAESAEDANVRAESAGLYFNGCDEGMDCKCCGDRWYPTYDKGDKVPSIYGTPITKPFDVYTLWMKDKPEGFVHYKNGKIKPFTLKLKKR